MHNNLNKNESKKGLSPLVATVLLIALVMVLALIIFLWAKGFITEQVEKFGEPIDKICSSILYDVAVTPGSVSQHAVQIINRGNVDIHNVDLKLVKGGEERTQRFEFNIPSGKTIKEDTYLKMESGVDPEKITAYPAIIGKVRGSNNNKAFTCLEQGITVRL